MSSGHSKVTRKPPIVALKYDEHLPGRENVAACLVWSTNSPTSHPGKKKRDGSKTRERKGKHSTNHERSPSPGFAPDSPEFQEHECNHDDENCAVEARRGWSRRQSEHEGHVDVFGLEEDNPDEFPVYYDGAETKDEKPKGQGGKKKRKGKKGKGDKDDAKDPAMWELIEHKFMRDAAEAREAKMAAEKAAALQKAKDARGKNSVRTNKTSQLRQIHNAPKVETSRLNMWKMKKFEKVPPHLDTNVKNEHQTADKENVTRGDPGVAAMSPMASPISGPASRNMSVDLTCTCGGGMETRDRPHHEDAKCMVRFEGLPTGFVTPPGDFRDDNTPASAASYYDTASIGLQTS